MTKPTSNTKRGRVEAAAKEAPQGASLSEGRHASSIRYALDLLTRLRDATGNSCLPMQQIHVLLYVALCGEVSMSDLERAACVSQASTSRNVTALGSGWPDEPGYGLLESFDAPRNRRRKLVRLTEKGKALAWDLLQG